MEKDEITKNFFQNWKAGITFRMYKGMILPLAEQDIIQNTDYIAYEKKAPETAVKLAQGLRKAIADLKRETVCVLRVLCMLVDAKTILLNMWL